MMAMMMMSLSSDDDGDDDVLCCHNFCSMEETITNRPQPRPESLRGHPHLDHLPYPEFRKDWSFHHCPILNTTTITLTIKGMAAILLGVKCHLIFKEGSRWGIPE